MHEVQKEHPTFLAAMRAAFVIGALALGATLMALVYLTVENRNLNELQVKQNAAIERQGIVIKKQGRDVQAISDRLLDCTDPKGKCYLEGQKRTGEAVAGINEITLKVVTAALACRDDGLTEYKELSKCVIDKVQSPQR
jgi:hypothetical protein